MRCALPVAHEWRVEYNENCMEKTKCSLCQDKGYLLVLDITGEDNEEYPCVCSQEKEFDVMNDWKSELSTEEELKARGIIK